jgi:hypothetical protein
MIMDAPDRGALMLVRFIAVSLICVTLTELTLYWVIAQHNHTSVGTFPCILKSIPAVAGIVMLIKARAIAEWISNKLDE